MKKSDEERAESPSRPSRRRRQSSALSRDYVLASEVRALMSKSDAARQERMQAADMISIDEAARLMQTTRPTIRAWISCGRAIGLKRAKQAIRLPRWQFEPLVWAALPRLSAALRTKEGWALLSFLELPLRSLDGRTPRQAIEQGHVDPAALTAEHDGN